MDDLKGIAITGIGCRFPGGADGPRAFWKLLCDGVDAISEIPPDRFNIEAHYDAHPGRRSKSIARWGGFLDSIDSFDAEFFGISPREAAFMDPQQRMLLRAAWEALEDGGVTLDRIEGSATGVFVGISTNDYAWLQSTPTDHSGIDVWSSTGGVASIAANRISYCLNLRGPSVAVDTACSSSLVAVHLACQSLRNGECTVALAGGVNALLLPGPFISFSRGGMLSPDGRCKAFDARANGFVRAEGVGVVVLKPLAAALASGDLIYAVIRGTAVNQDGKTNGITVPNAVSQVALVREACRVAGVSPRDVQYVEAHGTGTAVGDPIETEAIGTALSSDGGRSGPCVIGSVKTNIGHLEAGAGIAGLIKVALCLHHGAIPPNLHFETPNPRIDFERLRLRVAQGGDALGTGGGLAVAGVNSFGFGGTNAHAILSEASPRRECAATPVEGDRARLLVLSARSAESLRGLAAKHAEFLASTDDAGIALDDICVSAGRHRTHHAHRLTVVGVGREQLAGRLRAFAEGEESPGLFSGQTVADPGPVFVFSGQGPQWWAMGRELLAEEPVFRQKIDECEKALRAFGRWSLLEELSRDESGSRLQQTDIAQPAIFAIQVALAAVWQHWGIEPVATVGHSVGEVAAAHVAGVLSLKEAARVIFHRGRCMELASQRGRMLATGLSWAQAKDWVVPWADKISLAAFNGPNSVVLSGDGEALGDIAAKLEAAGVFCRFLQVNYAFHSQQMDPVREKLLRALGRVRVEPARLCLMSTVSGAEAAEGDFGAEYWWDNVRKPVLFATAIEALARTGHRTFLELSAHPVLGGPVAECLSAVGVRGAVLPSLRRKEPERATMLGSLGALHVRGAHVDFSALYPFGKTVRLPTYAWQAERYWSEAEDWHAARLESSVHPLLANSLKTASPAWRTSLDLEGFHYLKDHRIQGHVVFPAAGYVEMALGAGRALFDSKKIILEDFDFQRALFLSAGEESTHIEFCCDRRDGAFKISAADRKGDGREWMTHAIGRLRAEAFGETAPEVSLEDLRQRCPIEVPADDIYRAYAEAGFGFGPSFRGITDAAHGVGEALGRVQLTPEIEAEAGGYQVHPAMLDACFQVLSLAIPASEARLRFSLYLPVQIERVKLFGRPGGAVWCHAALIRHGGRSLAGDIRVFGDDGRVLMQIDGLRCQAAPQAGGVDEGLYALRWKPRPLRRITASADFIAPVTEVLGHANEVLGDPGDRRRGSSTSRDMDAGVDGLCREYFLTALDALGCELAEGASFEAHDLIEGMGVAPEMRPALACFIDLLVREGALRRVGGRISVCKTIARTDPEVLAQRILARFPGALPEVLLAKMSGRELAGVLRGTTAAPDLMRDDGPLPIAEHFYQDSLSCSGWNRAIAEAVSAAIGRRAEGQVVRILEIGAGTGGATAYIVPRLPRECVEYTFTDLSDSVFAAAEQKFFDFPFMRYRRLDAEKAPCDQGFEDRGFDVVVASNVLHALRDVGGALENLRTLLAPGGLLLLQEFLRPSWLADLALGMPGKWWREGCGADDPALGCGAWQNLLRERGYADVAAITGSAGDDHRGGVLLAARCPRMALANDGASSEVGRGQASGSWLLFADRSGVAGRVADALQAQGATVLSVHAGARFARTGSGQFEARADSAEDMRLLIKEITGAGGPALSGVVHFWSLDAEKAIGAGCDGLIGAEMMGCHSVVHLLQALGMEAAQVRPALFLITRGTQAVVDGDPVVVAQAPLWGLGRVITNELSRFPCRLIDLDASPREDEAAALLDEFVAKDREGEIALRGGHRFVQRLSRMTIERRFSASDFSSGEAGFQLQSPVAGALDRLSFRGFGRAMPGPGAVEIGVSAAALNFRDVMKALGIYPVEGDEDLLLGDECAGRVTAVGAGVKDWAVGDDVVAIGSGCFSSHLTIPAERLARLPEGLGFDEAATIPVAFLTAWYALRHLGRIREGDIALIHAATGGVGLAAIQVARLAGAQVLATAGSPWKRDFLRSMGISKVMDSRTVAFADEVREFTGGRGVDLVLNSLAGEAIASGISCLAPGGRFLEIGKRDIYQNARLALRPLRQNISFFVIDLARLMHDEPALVSEMLREILLRFKEGALHPLPLRAFRASRVGQAFRHMSQARHIGKIVVSMAPEGLSPFGAADGMPASLRSDSTYLITGGLGGFGLALADWMVERGARHLVLVGRGGASSAEAQRAVEGLRQKGCNVVVIKADISMPADADRLFGTIREMLPPLRGMVHAAMVMDDCTIERQTAERFHGVMAPKTLGAWNLHARSEDLALDFFVLFSSFSSVVGNPGQCSYAAANCFLDALAHHRRALGLPALVVNWGPLGEIGYIARHGDLEAALHTQGLSSLDPREATAMLGRLLKAEAAQAAVVKIEWRSIAGSMRGVATSPKFEEVRGSAEGDSAEGRAPGSNILDLPEAERQSAVTEALKEQVAKVLRVSVAKLDIQRPLNSLGFDSLMSVELANRIEGQFQVVLPPGKITASTTTADLAVELLGWMTRGSVSNEMPQSLATAGATRDGALDKAFSAAVAASAMAGDGLGASDVRAPSARARSLWLDAQFRVEWLLLRAGIAALRSGDYEHAVRRTRRLARWARPLLAFNWRWALQNLRLVFGPNLSERERRRLATLAFENHFISYLEGLRHQDVSFEIHGGEHVIEARTAARGVILCGVHLGSWEPGLSLGQYVGMPIAVVYRRARNPLSDRVFQKIRASYDVGWIVSADVAGAIEALRSNKVLGLMTDLNVTKGGTVADFLGVPARCPSGPARLALLQGSPIVPAIAIRLANGNLEVHFHRAIEPPRNDDTEAQVRDLTRRINAAFEPWILEYAEQYNWLHPRWRCRPDGGELSIGEPLERLAAHRTAPFQTVSARVRSLL